MAQFGLSFSFKSVYERYKMMNVITNRRFLPHLLPSLWTLLLLAGNFMGGIEKSCLQHTYSFSIALTARGNCKKSATFSIKLVI